MITKRVLKVNLSDTTIGRIVRQLGLELADTLVPNDRNDGKEVIVPQIAAVSCDGGRIRTREAGQGRGVTLANDTGWRETKNALFEKMSPHEDYQTNMDSCPRLPTSFRSAKKVANIAEKPTPAVPEPDAGKSSPAVKYKGPTRILRTAVSSMACSQDFGVMMKREASRRRFFDAKERAFLGDGLPWNWSIWKKHFPTFTPILDFVHAIEYLYGAAMAHSSDDESGWQAYLNYVTLCWQGDIAEVIAKLKSRCDEQGKDGSVKPNDDDRWKPVFDAIRYFGNNLERRDYASYRRAGLPVTSAPMESLIKQVNARVKGTEMFWDEPDGAEAILQLRAAALCDDDRLDLYLSIRPGFPFVRRATPTKIAA